MWGVAGALLAVPMLMAVKIFCEHVPSFRGVALFLSRDSHPEERVTPIGAQLLLSRKQDPEAGGNPSAEQAGAERPVPVPGTGQATAEVSPGSGA
jgi:hypothetical protein